MPVPTSKQVLKRFEFPITVQKAYEEDKKYFVEAIASDTGLDAYYEKVSENAIDKMVDQIKKEAVIILPTHWSTFDIGKVINSEKVDGVFRQNDESDLKALKVVIELNMTFPESQSLFEEVSSGDPKKQLSIGGWLNPDNGDAAYWEEVEYTVEIEGRTRTRTTWILVLDDLILDHIAVTRQNYAANEGTGFLSAIAKSLCNEYNERWEIVKVLNNDGLKRKHRSKEVKNTLTEQQILELQQAQSNFLAKTTAFFKNMTKMFSLEKGGQEMGDQTTKEEDKKNNQQQVLFDAEQIKAKITQELQEMINKNKTETNEVIKNSILALGETLTEVVKNYHETLVEPVIKNLQAKLEKIEKNAVHSSLIDGQDRDDMKKKSRKKKEEDDSEDTNVWAGCFGNIESLKSKILAIQSMKNSEEEDNEGDE